MSYSVKIEEIENGYVVLRPLEIDQKWTPGRKYVELGSMAVDEAIVQLQALRKELVAAEEADRKANSPKKS